VPANGRQTKNAANATGEPFSGARIGGIMLHEMSGETVVFERKGWTLTRYQRPHRSDGFALTANDGRCDHNLFLYDTPQKHYGAPYSQAIDRIAFNCYPVPYEIAARCQRVLIRERGKGKHAI